MRLNCSDETSSDLKVDISDLAKQLFRQTFVKWLTRPDSVRLVNELIDKAQSGNFGPYMAPSPIFKTMKYIERPQLLSPRPPVSPRRPIGIPEPNEEQLRIPRTIGIPSLRLPKPTFTFDSNDAEPTRDIESSRVLLPKLISLNQRLRNIEEEQKEIQAIEACFGTNSISREQFGAVVRACGLPTALSHRLYELTGAEDSLTLAKFMEFWKRTWLSKDRTKRFFEICSDSSSPGITREILVEPLMMLVNSHPSLYFLQDAADFKEKYVGTIIERIYYTVDLNDDGIISLRELKRSRLLDEWVALDFMDDINDSRQFFSYEHFFVIYCRFRELDIDMDYWLTASDLSNYDSFTLSHRAIERIFSGAARCRAATEQGKMNLAEFTWFMLSEEDKTSMRAIEYWFRVIDTDMNGIITVKEVEEFYEESISRLQHLNQDVMSLEEVISQVSDMTGKDGVFSLKDFQNAPSAAAFLFNLLVSLNKYFDMESTDPYIVSQAKLNFPGFSDWDRFALVEYSNRATDINQT